MTAKELVEQRDRWLDAEGLIEAEKEKRMLTNLYNTRPTWLELAHKKLDEAIFTAYGWPGDLSDEEILERLLAPAPSALRAPPPNPTMKTLNSHSKFESSYLGKAGRGQKRTLTSLYNAHPTWLELAHKKLDEAVFAAYGWPSNLSDEKILERLLVLNLGRAGDGLIFGDKRVVDLEV